MSQSNKVKTGYLYSGTVSLTATGGYRLFCSTLPIRSAKLLLICHPQKSVTGCVGPSRSSHAMPRLIAMLSTAQMRQYYAVIQRATMLMSDDLRLPRRGIEPRPSGFQDIGSTSRPLPLPMPINPALSFSSSKFQKKFYLKISTTADNLFEIGMHKSTSVWQ